MAQAVPRSVVAAGKSGRHRGGSERRRNREAGVLLQPTSRLSRELSKIRRWSLLIPQAKNPL